MTIGPLKVLPVLLVGAASLLMAASHITYSEPVDAVPAVAVPVTAWPAPSRAESWEHSSVTPLTGARYADFGSEPASADARHVADWVSDSRDTAGYPFIIIDKKFARVHVFDGAARLRGSSAVLLGSARGDDTVPGIGARPIAQVLAHERTTPAGRFVAERGRNMRGEDVIWVDYDAGVSIHRVLTTNPAERRIERLATPTVADNRISYGCINVPAAFYETTIRPIFALRRAIVYVLPEVRSLREVFGSYDVAAFHGSAGVPDEVNAGSSL